MKGGQTVTKGGETGAKGGLVDTKSRRMHDHRQSKIFVLEGCISQYIRFFVLEECISQYTVIDFCIGGMHLSIQ